MPATDISRLLNRNKNVPFVKRILDPSKYPSRKNKDGTTSSHLMSSAEVDGRHIVYPTLRYRKGKLVSDENPMTAMDSGNFIEFKDADSANKFAKGSWKKYAPKGGDDMSYFGVKDRMRLSDEKDSPKSEMTLFDDKDSFISDANLKYGIDKKEKPKPVGDGALGNVISSIASGSGNPWLQGFGIAKSLVGGLYDMVTADRPQIDTESLNRARAAGDWYDWEY